MPGRNTSWGKDLFGFTISVHYGRESMVEQLDSWQRECVLKTVHITADQEVESKAGTKGECYFQRSTV